MTLISIPAGRRQAGNTLQRVLFYRLLSPRVETRARERESKEMDVVHADVRGERADISPRTFTVKRVDGRVGEDEARTGDEDGRRVDEKRWGWLPNSNLGVGRVGKWAQCGVTLRAFALSPSAPPLASANPPPVIHLHSSPTVRRTPPSAL